MSFMNSKTLQLNLDSLFKLTYNFYKANEDQQTAIELCEILLQHHPENYNLLTLAADISFRIKDKNRTIKYLDKLYKINSSAISNKRALANINFKEGNYKESLKFYKEILLEDNDDIDTINFLADNAKSFNAKEILKLFNEIKCTDKNSIVLNIAYAKLYLFNDVKKTEEFCFKALLKDKNNLQANMLLITNYFINNENCKALNLINKLLRQALSEEFKIPILLLKNIILIKEGSFTEVQKIENPKILLSQEQIIADFMIGIEDKEKYRNIFANIDKTNSIFHNKNISINELLICIILFYGSILSLYAYEYYLEKLLDLGEGQDNIYKAFFFKNSNHLYEVKECLKEVKPVLAENYYESIKNKNYHNLPKLNLFGSFSAMSLNGCVVKIQKKDFLLTSQIIPGATLDQILSKESNYCKEALKKFLSSKYNNKKLIALSDITQLVEINKLDEFFKDHYDEIILITIPEKYNQKSNKIIKQYNLNLKNYCNKNNIELFDFASINEKEKINNHNFKFCFNPELLKFIN